ncbi:hypothetical protein [Thioalkalivibrio sp. AKL19]|nr:hypothetical protein [Thioalkalivibrio sp. AKL19]
MITQVATVTPLLVVDPWLALEAVVVIGGVYVLIWGGVRGILAPRVSLS